LLVVYARLSALCLCGAKKAEFTIASTSQLSSGARNWSVGAAQKLGLPTHFLPKIVPPGRGWND